MHMTELSSPEDSSGLFLLVWKRGQEPIVRSTLRAFWLLVPSISFQIKISFGLRETVEVGLISVCSRNQAAIQIDFSVGALTPRVSVIVWLLFF